MKRLICAHKEDYERKMRNLEDLAVLNVAKSELYRDSLDPPYRMWHRLARVEARRRGLVLP